MTHSKDVIKEILIKVLLKDLVKHTVNCKHFLSKN